MDIKWNKLILTDERGYSISRELTDKFWRRKTTLRDIIGPCFSASNPERPHLEGKIQIGEKTFSVALYILPRSKFNLMLGTNMTYGRHAESALIFTDRDFAYSTSTPAKLKKVIAKHQKEIETEVEKRLNGEWLYLNEEEQKKIVWED